MRKNKKIELIIGYQQAVAFLLLAIIFSIVAGICANYIYDFYESNNLHHFIFLASAAIIIIFGLGVRNILKESDEYIEKIKPKKKSKRK